VREQVLDGNGDQMNTETLNAIHNAVEKMRHSTLHNYIVPGLTSHLIGGDDKHGRVRLFHAERETREFITPHSHRFDFTCVVLRGSVRNTIFGPGTNCDEAYLRSTINQVCGMNGLNNYTHIRDKEPSYWSSFTYTYEAGDTYSMTHDEIHSIKFDRGTRVLFFEGPQVSITSSMIEPWENGKVVPTFKTEPWMFEKNTSEEAMSDLMAESQLMGLYDRRT
jgi:hypothetical protein